MLPKPVAVEKVDSIRARPNNVFPPCYSVKGAREKIFSECMVFLFSSSFSIPVLAFQLSIRQEAIRWNKNSG